MCASSQWHWRWYSVGSCATAKWPDRKTACDGTSQGDYCRVSFQTQRRGRFVRDLRVNLKWSQSIDAYRHITYWSMSSTDPRMMTFIFDLRRDILRYLETMKPTTFPKQQHLLAFHGSGDKVGIVGLGGLGVMGVKLAKALGCHAPWRKLLGVGGISACVFSV